MYSISFSMMISVCNHMISLRITKNQGIQWTTLWSYSVEYMTFAFHDGSYYFFPCHTLYIKKYRFLFFHNNWKNLGLLLPSFHVPCNLIGLCPILPKSDWPLPNLPKFDWPLPNSALAPNHFWQNFRFISAQIDVNVGKTLGGNAETLTLTLRMDFLTNIVYPELAQRVEDVQHHRKATFDANHMMVDLPKGSLVMVRNDVRGAKSSAAFEGPFTVERRTRGGTYILRDGDGQELHRKYAPSQIKMIAGANEAESSDKAYIVESIHDDRRIGSERWYWTKWKGYDESQNSWTRERDFLDLEVIRKYWKNKAKNP